MLKRIIRAAVAAIALVMVLVTPVGAWPVDDMNKTINQTNFVLDNICSATLISLPKKLVLTNYHCVEDKIKVVDKEVILPDGSVRTVKVHKHDTVSLVQKSYQGFDQVGSAEYMAEIVAHAKNRDLALLQIKAETIPHSIASQLAGEDVKVIRGEKVYAVGNPLMLDATVSDGIVSSVNRSFDFDWLAGDKLSFYQITAPITGGNSGGSLYNDHGQLIGVPAASSRGAGAIGLAVPAPVIRELLKKNCFESVYKPGADDAKCVAEREAKKKRMEQGPSGSAPDAHKENK